MTCTPSWNLRFLRFGISARRRRIASSETGRVGSQRADGERGETSGENRNRECSSKKASCLFSG